MGLPGYVCRKECPVYSKELLPMKNYPSTTPLSVNKHLIRWVE